MMRVEQLDLIAYGHYTDTTLDLSLPEHGLTVLYGPNEAGKSTARRALLAAFFGFERNNPDAHRYGRHGLRVGVRLSAADSSELSFVRQGLSRIVGEDGTDLDDDAVTRFCGGIGRGLYTRLFSIDHDELRTGSESLVAAEGEIGRLVFGASLGSGSVALALHRLDERAAKLFQERGRAQQIPRALDAYRGDMQRAKTARVRSREWDRRRQAVNDAEEQRVKVRADFERARADQARLERIQLARPLLARRVDVAGRLTALGNVPSEDWAKRTSEGVGHYRERRASRDSAVVARNRLAAEVDAISVPEALLERAGRIDKLVEGIGRYKKDTTDLPKRRTELDGVAGRLAEQLRVLGHASDDGRIVSETHLVAVEVLARRHVELVAEGRTAREELRKAREQVAVATARLRDLPEPPDVAPLDRALHLARPKVEAARDLVGGRTDQAAAAADLAAQAGRLGLGALGRDEIEALSVPTAAEVGAERDRRESHRLQLAQLEGERAKLAAATRTIENEIATLGVALPDPERLNAAREHRDAGWRIVRRTLQGEAVDTAWAVDAPLVDAYEVAVADADLAADERYDHADGMATLTQLRSRLADGDVQSRQLDEREEELVADGSAAARHWMERWAAIGVEDRPPEAMSEWLRDQRELVAGIGAWRQREAKLEAIAEDTARQRVALTSALAGGGYGPCSQDLDLVVAQAEDVVEKAHAMNDARRALATELRLAEEAEPRRTDALNQHEEALAGWQEEWAAAVQPLSLEPSVGPEAAAVAVAAYRALAAAREEAASLNRRIEGIEADRSAYADQVAGAAAGILAHSEDETPSEVVPELQRRLTAAREAHQRRETLAGELEQAGVRAEDAASLLGDARRTLIALRAEGGLPPSDDEPDAGLDAAVDQALDAASLCEKMREVESDLLEQGDGRSIDDIVAESAAAGDTLAGQTDAATADVEALTKSLEEAIAQLADARRSLEAVTDAATAADIEQDAQGELALASELATEYARTALAAEVLRRTIADYSERHRGPLLGRAGELFHRLTDGAYTELLADADGDRQVLLAKRRGGELCTAADLSDGARDQLYLALRLAGIEHQLGVVPDPPPVVLDDILVHFDDTRASAAVCAIGELARHTQVLLFTHHERVVEIARREMADNALAVVRLAPRNYDQPPASVAADARPPVATRASGRGEREAAEQEILAAASGGNGRALTKAELLERSGVAETQWTGAVRSLVEQGALIQEGQKRGARYRVPE